ncbi:MAG: hypothetical protein ACM3SX_21185, partial [Deltaproteobacteria bacterium]
MTGAAIMPSLPRRVIMCAALASLVVASVAAAQTSVILPGPSGRARVRFEISVPSSVRNEPLTGRVYVIISSDSSR